MAAKNMATERRRPDGQKESVQEKYTVNPLKSQHQNYLSGYRGIDPKPVRQVSWQDAIEEIRSGKYKEQVERARQILEQEGRDEYNKVKCKLPSVTFAGIFSHRKNACIENSTGFIIPDIDHITDINQTFGLLSQDENIWFVFKSPGGDGIKCGLRSENIQSDADHKKFFNAVEIYFKSVYGIEIDRACKDISRLTFLSYDPDALINLEPTYFEVDSWTAETTPGKIALPQIPTTSNGDGHEKYARKVLESACQKIMESTPGSMHSTRLSMARLVGGYLHYGISDAEALEALETAAAFSDTANIDAAMKTIRDGLENGKLSPVTIPEKCDTTDGLKADISALLKLDIVAREVARNELSKKHNVRKSVIDQFVKFLEDEKKDAGTTEIVTPATAWESSVDGGNLITAINDLLKNHVILPDNTSEAIAAWVLLTYCFDSFRILPILGVISPQKRCGKTTLLETLQGLCNKALLASNVSPSAVFRTIEKYQPTLLIDEADSFLKDNEELRGVLNSGHTRSAAFVIRVQGDDHEPMKFSTWAPKAVAMIGDLPETLADRSIMVKLRRKAQGERVKKIGLNFESECQAIRRKCQRWADDTNLSLKKIHPELPPIDNDRATDNWWPLFCIAHAIGGTWPEQLKRAMLKNTDADEDTTTTQLLSDIRDIFKDHCGDRMFSDVLVEKLKGVEDHPWSDWNRGKGLTQTGLARLLKPFSIYSRTVRIGTEQRKGYEKSLFDDTFGRYLSQETPIQTVPTYQANKHKALGDYQTVPQKNVGTDKKQPKHLQTEACNVGTDENGYLGEDREYSDCEWMDLEEQEDRNGF